jgi:hypothetical protein
MTQYRAASFQASLAQLAEDESMKIYRLEFSIDFTVIAPAYLKRATLWHKRTVGHFSARACGGKHIGVCQANGKEQHISLLPAATVSQRTDTP